MLDLDSILKIYTDYEARKQTAREWEIKNFGKVDEKHVSRLASCADGEAEKAFEALRPLVERVRELERMADIMAEQLACVEIAPSICRGCEEQDIFGMYSCGGKDCIYFMVKQAAKEAGE